MELINITIWLTNICNLKCAYCYEKEKLQTSLTKEKALRITQYIKKYIKEKNINIA